MLRLKPSKFQVRTTKAISRGVVIESVSDASAVADLSGPGSLKIGEEDSEELDHP